MPKAKSKKTTAKKKTGLRKEVPTLHSLVIILYILLGICFLAIFMTRFSA